MNFVASNNGTDKMYYSIVKLINDIGKITQNNKLLTALQNCKIKKTLREKNLVVNEKILCGYTKSDHPLMQSIFRERQNYRSVRNVGSCRACTIIPSEYHKYTVCCKSKILLSPEQEVIISKLDKR
uniref:LAGLIDADG_2 domain-containing protein n=1 Tax=Strongyloides venezuelensis TaxID=75913 RepID=A0A0K0F0H3_STRVS